MSKQILIDGREFVLGRRTGIGRFLEGLLQAVVEAHPSWRMVVVMDEVSALPESLHGKVESLQAPSYLEWHWPKLAQGFDLFFSPYPKLPVRGMPCPMLHTVHDVFYLTHPAYQENRLRRFSALWRLKHAVSKADFTWFVSKASQEETEMLTGAITHDTAVRYSSIEPSFKPDRRIKKQDFFLFVGNGLPHKNVQTLLAAIKGTSVKLECVGIREDIAEKLRTLFQVDAEQVEFLQAVDDKGLIRLYRQSKALLLPSTAEGYGYPPLEAMACGTPAIVSDILVLRESTGGFATFCPAQDAQAWRDALVSFEPSPQMIEQGLAWAQSHQGLRGWAEHIQDMTKLVNH